MRFRVDMHQKPYYTCNCRHNCWSRLCRWSCRRCRDSAAHNFQYYVLALASISCNLPSLCCDRCCFWCLLVTCWKALSRRLVVHESIWSSLLRLLCAWPGCAFRFTTTPCDLVRAWRLCPDCFVMTGMYFTSSFDCRHNCWSWLCRRACCPCRASPIRMIQCHFLMALSSRKLLEVLLYTWR